MRRILVNVWQGVIKPSQALQLLQLQELTRAGPMTKEEKELVLGVLEALKDRILTTNEAEEEIEWILNNQKETTCQT